MAIEQSDRPSNPPRAMVVAADFRFFLEYILRNNGLSVVADSDGDALMERLQERQPDLLLLESRLSNLDVQALCACLRLDERTRAMAILVLAAEGDAANQKEIIESGADEYLARPFSPDKLIASVRALLRERANLPETGAPDLMAFLDLELDPVSYRVLRSGRMIHLAPTEFRLLYYLMKNPRKVHSRDELQHAAWPPSVHLGPRTVDVHIGRLRAALNEPSGQELIRTVRSVGYGLSE
jgi:two-component system phosphate regulon response regulator PhoB